MRQYCSWVVAVVVQLAWASVARAATCPTPMLPPGQEAAIQAAFQPDTAAIAMGISAGDIRILRDRIGVAWHAGGARHVYVVAHAVDGASGLHAGTLMAAQTQPCLGLPAGDPRLQGWGDFAVTLQPAVACPVLATAMDGAFLRALQQAAAVLKWQCATELASDPRAIAKLRRVPVGDTLRDIDAKLREGDREAAEIMIALAERQAKSDSLDVAARFDLGLALWRLQRRGPAKAALEMALGQWQPAWQLATTGTDTQVLSDQVVVTERAAAAQAVLGQLDQATATLEQCWRVVTVNSCTALPLADVLEQAGHAERAEALLDRQLLQQKIPEAAWLRARIGLASRRDDARSELRTAEAAVAAYPHALDLQESLASACFRSGQHLRAVRLLEGVYNKDPRQPGVLGRLSGVVNDWGRVDPPREGQVSGWQQLRDEMSRRASSDPKDVIAQFLYGVSLFYDAKFDQALAQMRKVEPMAPTEGRVYIYQAMAQLWLGHPELAQALADKAVAANPHDPDVYYCQSQVLRQTNMPAAVQALQRYLTLETAPGSLHFAKKTKRVEQELALLRQGKMPPLWDKPGHYDDEDGPAQAKPEAVERTVRDAMGSLRMWLIVTISAALFIGGGTWLTRKRKPKVISKL